MTNQKLNKTNIFHCLLILILGNLSTNVFAATSGLIINDDSMQLSYVSRINDIMHANSRQHYSLIISKERNPRNILLSADSELRNSNYPFVYNTTFTPTLGLAYLDFLDQTAIGLYAGVILRQPADDRHKYDLLTEFIAGPHGFDIGQEWGWRFRMQMNFPVDKNIKLNFGFRRIEFKNMHQHLESFESGLYFGLSTQY